MSYVTFRALTTNIFKFQTVPHGLKKSAVCIQLDNVIMLNFSLF